MKVTVCEPKADEGRWIRNWYVSDWEGEWGGDGGVWTGGKEEIWDVEREE